METYMEISCTVGNKGELSVLELTNLGKYKKMTPLFQLITALSILSKTVSQLILLFIL